jgi:hypothetical protein
MSGTWQAATFVGILISVFSFLHSVDLTVSVELAAIAQIYSTHGTDLS